MSRRRNNSGKSHQVRFPRYEFLVLFLPVALLIVVVGLLFAGMQEEAHYEEIIERDSHWLHLMSGFAGAEVTHSLHHLRALVDEPAVNRAISGHTTSARAALTQSLLTLARRNPHYQQVRWIDESGHERVRINRDTAEPYIVTDDALQDKSDHAYVKAGNGLLQGEFYVSKIDLNVEDGQIEVPVRPMLRIATPLFDAAKNRRGILIVNLAMRHLFDVVQPGGSNASDVQVMVLNSDGTLLNWFDLSIDSDGLDFTKTHPVVWEQVLPRRAGHLETANGLWTWKKVSPMTSFERLTNPVPDAAKVLDRVITERFSLVLLVHRPVAALMEVRRDSRVLVSLGIVLSITVYGLALFFYLSGHVRARQAEINTAFKTARVAGEAKYRELEQRFFHLVSASGIGQIAVNKDGQIEIANQAAQDILGYSENELVGARLEKLLPPDLRTRHESMRQQYMNAPQARAMGIGRTLTAIRKDGTAIPVEIGLNPYVEDGETMIAASIVDLSKDKD